MPIPPKKYLVLKDTREKQGWFFKKHERCEGTLDQKLDTGDYTIQGYETVLTVERKKSVEEIAHNINEKRFTRELERLEEFKLPFVVCEFTLDEVINFPLTCKYASASKISGRFILMRLTEMMVKYKTRFIFAGIKGQDFTSSLFKRVIDNV